MDEVSGSLVLESLGSELEQLKDTTLSRTAAMGRARPSQSDGPGEIQPR